MSFLAAVIDAVAKSGARETCFSCARFCNDPQLIEAQVPGLATLSSAHGSVRAQDGLCIHYDVIINGRRRCDAYLAPAESAANPGTSHELPAAPHHT
jgi:hypothetical protein